MNLNTDSLADAMRQKGLSQADVAHELSVTREAVSKWMRGTSTPRVSRVLRLSRLLDLAFDDIYVRPPSMEPVVAFRKKGSAKTTKGHLERAKDMGYLLRELVDYLPFDVLSHPASFIDPKSSRDYVQRAAREIRNRMHLTTDVVDCSDIIKFFAEVHAVLVPVMWGKKQQHENALHIHLPDSKTTWVFLNLDVKIMDFKFWMAHELAHVKSPSLEEPESEEFADQFATELLFPHDAAETHFRNLRQIENPAILISKIQDIATDYLISPVTVLSQLNRVAEALSLEQWTVNIHPSTTNLNKRFLGVNEIVFGTDGPTATSFVRICSDTFETPFYDALRSYLRETGKEPSFVQRILNIGPIDAKNLHRALLSQDDPKDPA